MRESEKKYLVDIDIIQLVTHIKKLLGLTEIDKRIVKTTDYYFDTPDLDFFKNGVSLRIRKKNKEFRATLKTPILLDSAGIVHRNEIKLKFKSKTIEEIKIFLKNFSLSLSEKSLIPIVILQELSQEVNIKKQKECIALSYDFVTYIDYHNHKNLFSETILELEDHGIGVRNLKKVCKFIDTTYRANSTTKSKYERAIEILGVGNL